MLHCGISAPAYVSFGSDSVIRRCRLRCPVCPKADTRHTGRQHAQFGVKSSHFVAFGDALIWRLEQQFGAAFTPQLKKAWIELYGNVQREMLRVANSVPVARRSHRRKLTGA